MSKNLCLRQKFLSKNQSLKFNQFFHLQVLKHARESVFRSRQSLWYISWKYHRVKSLSLIRLTGKAILGQKQYHYLNGRRIHLVLFLVMSVFLKLKFFLKWMFLLSFRNTGRGWQQCNNGTDELRTMSSHFLKKSRRCWNKEFMLWRWRNSIKVIKRYCPTNAHKYKILILLK